jgi:hypothetical protein
MRDRAESCQIDVAGLGDYFSTRKDTVAAYLFGSSTGAGRRLKGDVDIAVLLGSNAARRPIKTQVAILRDVQNLLGRTDVDVIVLNDAPLVLRFEVLRNKKLIFERNIRKRVDFEVLSELKYFDWEPMRRFFCSDLRTNVKKGRIVYG